MSTSRAITFNGAQGVLGYMGSNVLASVGTNLTVSGLNLSADGTYYFEFGTKDASASAAVISLIFNGDTTVANYNRQNLVVNSTGISGTRGNNSQIVQYTASQQISGYGFISLDIDGRARARVCMNSGASASVIITDSAVSYVTVANVTSVQLQHSSANGFTSGSYLRVYRISSGVALSGFGYAEGAAFPASPATGQKFYRTDINHLCYYDGARWLTEQEYHGQTETNPAKAVTGAADVYFPLDNSLGNGIYITRMALETSLAGGTSNSSNKWVIQLQGQVAGGGVNNIGSSADTGVTPDAVSTLVDHSQTINSAVTTATGVIIFLNLTKTGSPGNLTAKALVRYRLIVT